MDGNAPGATGIVMDDDERDECCDVCASTLVVLDSTFLVRDLINKQQFVYDFWHCEKCAAAWHYCYTVEFDG